MPAPEQFHYDPSKPIEPQIRAFLNGRDPYGSVGNRNVFEDPSLYERYSTTDESGTTNYGYRARDPRLSDVSSSGAGPTNENRVIDGHYTPVSWANSDSPDALNGLKPDSMNSYDGIYYDPQFGLITDGSNMRDPSARHDLWYGMGIMGAVAAPAIAGILAGAGGGAGGAGGYGSMTGVAGDESAGLLGTGSYGGGAGGAAGGGYGSMTGVAGDESAGLLGTGSYNGAAGGLTPLEGVSLQPETLFNTMDPSPLTLEQMGSSSTPWWQRAGQGLLSNPMNLARTGLGIYSMLQAGGGGGGGGSSSSTNFGPGAFAGPVPQLKGVDMGQFMQNPFLQQQMQNVPFMGNSYALGF